MSKSNNPKITVITPNYNHAHYLPEMLDSTLDQSPQPHQLILIDDASTDNSLQVLNSYQQKHSNIQIIQNPSNLGPAHSVNKGLIQATGDFLVFRSADDLSLPNAFQNSINILQQFPQAGLCCGDLTHFFDDSPSQRTEPASLPNKPTYFSPSETISVLQSNPILGHTVMARTSAAKSAGAYHPELLWYSDWFFFLVIALKHGFCYTPQPLAANRLRANSLGNATMANPQQQKSVLKAMINLILSDYPDLIHAFAQSKVFDNFFPLINELYHQSPDLQTPQVQSLLHSTLNLTSLPQKSGLSQIIQQTLSQKQSTINQLAKDFPNKKFYIYGAGSHTSALLQEWSNLNLPKIDAILQSSPSSQSHLNSIPIITLDQISPPDTNLITISSKSFEESMLNNCYNNLNPIPNLITFWNTSKSTI